MPTRSNKSYGWIKREGKLGGPGYTKKSAAARHRILAGVVKKYGYRSALGSIMALERSTQISATVRKALVADRVWLRENYGAASKKALAAGKKTAAQRRAKKTTPRRVPSVARRTRKVKAAVARMPSASRRPKKRSRAPYVPTQSVAELRAMYDREVAAGEYGAAALTLRSIRAAQGKPVGRMPSRADRIGMLTPGWRPNPKAKTSKTTGRKVAASTRREQEERQAAAEARRLLEGYVPQGPGELYRWEANPQLPPESLHLLTAYVVDPVTGFRQKFADVYRVSWGAVAGADRLRDTPAYRPKGRPKYEYITYYADRPGREFRDEVLSEMIDEIEKKAKRTSRPTSKFPGMLEYVEHRPGILQEIRRDQDVDRKPPTRRKLRRTRPNPGSSECGYHGVPTMRGECVVCQYEADIKG